MKLDACTQYVGLAADNVPRRVACEERLSSSGLDVKRELNRVSSSLYRWAWVRRLFAGLI